MINFDQNSSFSVSLSEAQQMLPSTAEDVTTLFRTTTGHQISFPSVTTTSQLLTRYKTSIENEVQPTSRPWLVFYVWHWTIHVFGRAKWLNKKPNPTFFVNLLCILLSLLICLINFSYMCGSGFSLSNLVLITVPQCQKTNLIIKNNFGYMFDCNIQCTKLRFRSWSNSVFKNLIYPLKAIVFKYIFLLTKWYLQSL